MTPTVAIVILNYNGRTHLEQFLPSVLSSTYANATVIVADNASTDDSLSFLQEEFPSVQIIRLPQNYGFAKGYNEALRQVSADYYILLNSDVEVDQAWIEPILELMESNEQIGACQPKILMYRDKERFEYAGAAGGWLDSLGYPFARGRIFDYCERDRGQYDTTEPVFWASGAALFVRAALYHQLGGLDEYFFAHQEEIDFCWRLQLAGYRVMACPLSRVYHLGGGTLPKGNERKVLLNFRNNLIMLAKNLPATEAVWKIALRILLDSVSAWKSLFDGEATYFIAIAEAHWGFVKWFFGGRKRSVFPARRGKVADGWYQGSIIWKHFINGIKRFSDVVGEK
ncbi:MAG: glycosyltransferase family 2 protein [Williamsia sp.]|nr:glycosyltransferase family 2 protein [Williamsia sp.]